MNNVSLAEAAAITGVSVDTVKRRIKRGELPAVYVGKAIRVPAEALGGRYIPPGLHELVASEFQHVGSLLNQLAEAVEQGGVRLAQVEKSVTALSRAVRP